MKSKKIFTITILIFSFLLLGHQALASNTNGTIDPTYRYAWGENVGFVDFKNTTISDSSLSGLAYGDNIGWIDLSTITNDNEGTLGGYAWGENVGWVDFSKVIIGNDGIFTGSAYGENIGFITFNTNDNNKVVTDWRPRITRTVSRSSSSSGGSIIRPVIPAVTPSVISCLPVYLFDTNTGRPCTVITLLAHPTITRTLKLITPRMTGADVKDLQTYLNTHSYNAGTPDGVFGNLTKASVIKFQLANQLKGDGVVGPLTRSKLIN